MHGNKWLRHSKVSLRRIQARQRSAKCITILQRIMYASSSWSKSSLSSMENYETWAHKRIDWISFYTNTNTWAPASAFPKHSKFRIAIIMCAKKNNPHTHTPRIFVTHIARSNSRRHRSEIIILIGTNICNEFVNIFYSLAFKSYGHILYENGY